MYSVTACGNITGCLLADLGLEFGKGHMVSAKCEPIKRGLGQSLWRSPLKPNAFLRYHNLSRPIFPKTCFFAKQKKLLDIWGSHGPHWPSLVSAIVGCSVKPRTYLRITFWYPVSSSHTEVDAFGHTTMPFASFFVSSYSQLMFVISE